MSTNSSGGGHGGHALCSASSSNRWLNCPGSVALCREAPREPTSIYAEEGTKAHKIAEETLRAWIDKTSFEAVIEEIEMLTAVKNYVDYVVLKAAEFDEPPSIRLESKLVLNGELNMWGTADVAMTGVKNGEPHGKIIDLKYGKTKVVAEGNTQLAYYGAALLKTSSKKLKDVEVNIFQPRIKKAETSITYTAENLNRWHGVLSEGCNKAMLQVIGFNKREYVVGEWCKYCSARTICPERLKSEWTEEDGKEFEEGNK